MNFRRDFALPDEDRNFLEEYGLPWETISDGSQWVLLHDFPTHDGYNHATVTTAIRLEVGYPNAPLDMVYFYPKLLRLDGKQIGASFISQMISGRDFQRWSRHRSPQNPWDADQDNLGTHIILIEDWLEREFEK